MQALFSNKKAQAIAIPRSSRTCPIVLPQVQYRKIIDFLEYKWGTNIVKRNNEFFRASRQDRPIARLSSEGSLIVALVDQTTGRWHEVKTKIEDIELPKPIMVEQRIYRNLLYQLARSSEGIIRWINKFYSTATGNLIAELVSNEKIRIFKTEGLFEPAGIVSIEDFAAVRVPKEQYFHLLDFLVQQSGGEVRRVGNEFYPSKENKLLDSILKSLGTISKSTTSYLNTTILARLVSSSAVRFPDGTTRNICDLVLSSRVYRAHLYFCNSCQSFVRIPYRTTMHQSKSGNHEVTYVSSSINLVQISKTKATKKHTKKFPEILYTFWGIEKGKVPREKRKGNLAKDKQFQTIDSLPIYADKSRLKARAESTTSLLLSAEIIIDGYRLSSEERVLAHQRLEGSEIIELNAESIEDQVDSSMHEHTLGADLGNKTNFQETVDLPELMIET